MWRGRGERFQDTNMSEHDRYGGGSIVVWAGISRGGRTYPHIVIKGMMTSLCYRDDILEVYIRPYAGAIGLSSSLWTTTLDLISPGWLRSTPSRRPSSAWTGQHAHRSQPDRACLENATGGDCATSSPTHESRGT